MKDYEVALEVKKTVVEMLAYIDRMKSDTQDQINYYNQRWEESATEEADRDSYYADEKERFMIKYSAYEQIFDKVYKLL